MLPLSEARIRASFLNTSLSERKSVSLPSSLESIDWGRLDFFGWRDPKLPQVGYVVLELDGADAGVLLRKSDAKPRSRAQCSWCTDVELPNEVVFFGARRAGAEGRRGDTVGTLACADFECSANVRRRPATAYIGFDVEAARQRRIEGLQSSIRGFVRGIRDGV